MRISKKHLVLTALGTLSMVVLVALPGALRGRVGEAVDGFAHADPRWLWLAAAALAVMHGSTAIAWSSGLRACGATVAHGDATARYCVGSAVGAVAPCHLGSAARIALFGRAVEGAGALWRIGGVVALVGAVRGAWFSALVVVAVVVGPLPAWLLLALGGAAAVAAALAYGTRRVRLGARLDHLLLAFRALGRSPRRLAGIGALTLVALTAKVAAAAAVAAALGIDHPLLAAALIVPAVELSSIMPVTPGNAGVASAAIAVALASIEVPTTAAIGAGLAFGAIEIVSALAVGLVGAIVLAAPRLTPVARVSAVAATWCALVGAASLTLVPAL